MNRKMTELLQNMPKADSAAFLEDARREAKTIQIPQTAWCKAHGFKSEKEYKAVMARKGGLMYHTHFCFPSREAMVRDMTRLEGQLAESGVVLDRFGVSLDPSPPPCDRMPQLITGYILILLMLGWSWHLSLSLSPTWETI